MTCVARGSHTFVPVGFPGSCAQDAVTSSEGATNLGCTMSGEGIGSLRDRPSDCAPRHRRTAGASADMSASFGRSVPVNSSTAGRAQDRQRS
eukprot:scaffold4815_cov363-Prasinococcus_capsulatus_cf.AAC.4